jgi:aldose sugar dehydrogenase
MENVVKLAHLSPSIVSTLALLMSGSAAGFGATPDAPPAADATEQAKVRLETVVGKLEHPWGVAFFPDGRALITERPGRLRILERDGRLGEPISGLPAFYTSGQGGLLDVAIDPDFARSRLVFFSFAEPREDDMNGTAVGRGRLEGNRLEDMRVIFHQQPAMKSTYHFGSRLVFAKDGTLFVTMGDRNIGRDKVQDLGTDIGKIARIDRDGKPPADNPFLNKAGARPELWSVGHRNVQGAALNPETAELWTVEHGPKGGDELNRTLGGRNYGWPMVTYGREYSGAKITDRTEAPGMESPVHHWVPSISPSGLLFYTGNGIPRWRGNLFVGALSAKQLVRLEMSGNRVVHEERLFGNLGHRIRDVEQGPDGALYILTDEDAGSLLRIVPAN